MEVIPSIHCIFGPGVCDLSCFGLRNLLVSWDRLFYRADYCLLLDAIYMHSCGVCLFFLGFGIQLLLLVLNDSVR